MFSTIFNVLFYVEYDFSFNFNRWPQKSWNKWSISLHHSIYLVAIIMNIMHVLRAASYAFKMNGFVVSVTQHRLEVSVLISRRNVMAKSWHPLTVRKIVWQNVKCAIFLQYNYHWRRRKRGYNANVIVGFWVCIDFSYFWN